MRLTSTTSPSPSTPTSASISGKKGSVTFEAVFTASKSELTALFASCGLAHPASGLSQTALQSAFIAAYGNDLNTPLSAFVNAVTARRLQQEAEKASSVQAGCTDLHQRLARSAKDTIEALSAAQEQWKQQESKTAQHNRDLDSMKAKLQDLHCLQDAAAAPCSAPCDVDSSYSLRCTGLKEEPEETEEDLLQKVNEMLDQLSSKVTATDARRQGRPGARKGRAVIMSFDMLDDRSAVLRTKSQLSKIADLRSVSIDVVLNAEQQQQKNLLWPSYMQARQTGQRAFWRGCRLFINGQHVQEFYPPAAPSGFEHMNGGDMNRGFADLSPSSFPAPHLPSLASSSCVRRSSFPPSAPPPHHQLQHLQHFQPQQQQHIFQNQIAPRYAKSTAPLPMRP